MQSYLRWGLLAFLSGALLLPTQVTVAAQAAPAEKERSLLRVLQSGAPKDKAIACKELAIYGGPEAVKPLAALLSDEDLSSWARIALEAIPGPEPDAALRKALPRLHGKLLVGAINSIGYRRDPKAVGPLSQRLRDLDSEVVAASAVALGRIGGTKAARALEHSLLTGSPKTREAAAQGAVLCAEKFLDQKEFDSATKLYDTIRSAPVSGQRVLEATRGAILARQSEGLPLLLEQLRSADKGRLAIGLRTARELPGLKVTEALASELERTGGSRQAFLLLALADRDDAAVLPALLRAASGGSSKLRVAAIGALEQRGHPGSVRVLLDAAADPDDAVAQAAIGALARLPGTETDNEILSRPAGATGKQRRILIDVAGKRRILGALPAIEQSASDSDPTVRAAAVSAMGALGDERQTATLAKLLEHTQDAKEREGIEAALIAIGGRRGAACVPPLLPLAESKDAGLRVIALHALAGAGGPKALSAVVGALQDQDASVQDEAARSLSTWPNNWPEDSSVAEPLLSMAKTDTSPAHQALGMRGYLQYIQGDKQLGSDAKAAKIAEVLPLLKRPEEKRMAITALNGVQNAKSLEVLVGFAGESDLAEDACAAIVEAAGHSEPAGLHDQRRQALQVAANTSKNAKTKKRAEELLKKD